MASPLRHDADVQRARWGRHRYPSNRGRCWHDLFQTGTYDYIDLAFGFGIAKRYSLRLSGNNLFDTDPPLLPNARNVLGLLRNDTLMGHDLLGRQIVAGVTATF